MDLKLFFYFYILLLTFFVNFIFMFLNKQTLCSFHQVMIYFLYNDYKSCYKIVYQNNFFCIYLKKMLKYKIFM